MHRVSGAQRILAVDGNDFFGSETCGQHNFQHLNARAVAQLAVADAGRLVYAGASLQAHCALALVLEFNPSLEKVDELKFSVVQMRLAGKFLLCRRAYDMGIDTALGGLSDSQVAVLEERSQAALERGVLCEATRREGLSCSNNFGHLDRGH